MVTRRQQSTLFLFIFSVFNWVNVTHSHEISLGTKYELTHRHHLRRNNPNRVKFQPASQLGRVKQLVHKDTIRLREISHRMSLTRRNGDMYYPDCTNTSRTEHRNLSGELQIHSAADYGTGQYFVHMKVGSPAQKVVLIADTGSDLTWMNCKYRCHGARCRSNLNKTRVFRADHSASFTTVPCSSRSCSIDLANLFSLSRCPSPVAPCAYDYRYGDGSSTQGLFANETVTFSLTDGKKTRLHNMLVGCSKTSSGTSFRAADGVMGLGYSNYSFAVKTAKIFGGKFSYCLVDHLSPKNISSYLIFGSHKETSQHFAKMRYTKLVLGVINPFYAVSVKGISVGGLMMNIPVGVWKVNSTGGTIIDSGSSLTSLVQPAYEPVMAALRSSLLNFRNLDLNIGPLEYCFNSTGFKESSVPRLVFHFADGARFEPPVKSYVIDAAPGIKCLGLIPAAFPGASVIGNIMQQNHVWEFDLVNGKLGFGSSSCR